MPANILPVLLAEVSMTGFVFRLRCELTAATFTEAPAVVFCAERFDASPRFTFFKLAQVSKPLLSFLSYAIDNLTEGKEES